jgi:hypothetical protein
LASADAQLSVGITRPLQLQRTLFSGANLIFCVRH